MQDHEGLFISQEKADVVNLNKFTKRNIFAIIVVFVLLVILFTIIIVHEAYGSIFTRKIEAENLAIIYSSEIERNCMQTFLLNGIIADLIRIDENTEENFPLIAARLLPEFPAADSVQLAPAGTVGQVYPLKGNEAVIGHNLFADPNRVDEALLTKKSKKITIGGPYLLLQGGEGFIARFPVFTDEAKTDFWGFVSVVVRVSRIMETIDLSAIINNGFYYSIYRIDDASGETKMIYGRNLSSLKDPVSRRIEMPNAHWEIAVAPETNWVDIHLIAVLVTLSVLLILTFIGLLLLMLRLRLSNIKLAQLASLDQLTGLYSKQTALFSLKKEIDYAERNDSQIGVCFIDMNDFKQINDTFGHAAGDAALIKVAKRLTGAVRPEDIVARFGGDEFIIIFRGKNTGTDYHSTADRIRSALNVPAKLNGHITADISAAIGLAVYPENGRDVESLIRYADKAMYESKLSMKKEDIAAAEQ